MTAWQQPRAPKPAPTPQTTFLEWHKTNCPYLVDNPNSNPCDLRGNGRNGTLLEGSYRWDFSEENARRYDRHGESCRQAYTRRTGEVPE